MIKLNDNIHHPIFSFFQPSTTFAVKALAVETENHQNLPTVSPIKSSSLRQKIFHQSLLAKIPYLWFPRQTDKLKIYLKKLHGNGNVG